MKIALYLISMILLVSCGPGLGGATRTYTLVVRNESGVNVKVRAFNTNSQNKSNVKHTTIFKNNEEISKTHEDGLPPKGYFYSDFFGRLNGTSVVDSIQVIFNNEKFLSYNNKVCDQGGRNPLSLCIYSSTYELFIFTVEDYENAEDCNSNCE